MVKYFKKRVVKWGEELSQSSQISNCKGGPCLVIF